MKPCRTDEINEMISSLVARSSSCLSCLVCVSQCLNMRHMQSTHVNTQTMLSHITLISVYRNTIQYILKSVGNRKRAHPHTHSRCLCPYLEVSWHARGQLLCILTDLFVQVYSGGVLAQSPIPRVQSSNFEMTIVETDVCGARRHPRLMFEMMYRSNFSTAHTSGTATISVQKREIVFETETNVLNTGIEALKAFPSAKQRFEVF